MTEPGEPRGITPEQQSRILNLAVQDWTTRGYRPVYVGPSEATLARGGGPNHILHLLITLVSCGLWAPIWLGAAIFVREERHTVWVDQWGRVGSRRDS